MNNTLALMLTLLLPVIGFAQDAGQPSADPVDGDLQKVVQLAALQPDTQEFDDAWSAYVSDNRDGMDVAATIDKVIKESGDFLRQITAPGHGSTRRAISNSELREKMHALAAAAIEDGRR